MKRICCGVPKVLVQPFESEMGNASFESLKSGGMVWFTVGSLEFHFRSTIPPREKRSHS